MIGKERFTKCGFDDMHGCAVMIYSPDGLMIYRGAASDDMHGCAVMIYKPCGLDDMPRRDLG